MKASKRNTERRETWTAEYVARSKRFQACMFLGVGKYDRRESDTLEGARAHREAMLSEWAGKNYGRGVVIYAITPNHLSIFVE